MITQEIHSRNLRIPGCGRFIARKHQPLCPSLLCLPLCATFKSSKNRFKHKLSLSLSSSGATDTDYPHGCSGVPAVPTNFCGQAGWVYTGTAIDNISLQEELVLDGVSMASHPPGTGWRLLVFHPWDFTIVANAVTVMAASGLTSSPQSQSDPMDACHPFIGRGACLDCLVGLIQTLATIPVWML